MLKSQRRNCCDGKFEKSAQEVFKAFTHTLTCSFTKHIFGTEKGFPDQIPTCVCVEVSPHQQAILRFHQVSEKSTQFWHYLKIESDSTGKRPSSTSDTNFKSRLLPVLLMINWLQIRLPWTPFSDSINLLEQLMELKKTHLHTRLLIYYKRILKVMNQQPNEGTHVSGKIPNSHVLLFATPWTAASVHGIL